MMRRAFTLIELLTVIAISAILLGIITIPIFQSFNLTRSAQGYSDAQDRARLVAEAVAREVGNSAGVLDNTGLNGSVAVRVPSGQGSDVADAEVLLPFAKLNVLMPARGEPELDVNGNPIYRNDQGVIDPTLTAPRGQIVLPVAPGATVKRYWIGLRDPFQKYVNPYDGLLMARSGSRDNLYVLYEAEVQPYALGTAQGDASLFEVDGQGSILDFHDPRFFLPNLDGSGNVVANDAKANRIRNWQRKARILTEISRYDMVFPVYDRRSRQVVYDVVSQSPRILAPRLVPLVQFRPTRVSNEPAAPMMASRLGEETDNAEAIGPEVFRTEYGGWTQTVVRTWPSGFNRSGSNDYLVGRRHQASGGPRFSIFAFDPDSSAGELTGGVELFDVDAYEDAVANGRLYPFTIGVNSANGRSNWLGDVALRNLFMGYTVDAGRGRIQASFAINEVGTDSPAPSEEFDRNVPTVGTGDALSPAQDSGSGAVFGGTGYQINQAFNRAWNENAGLRPNLHRYIDLRVTPNLYGGVSPLHPNPSLGFRRARIVPGSEVVIGPDQTPGANYGNPIRYTRVLRNPGPNQYALNYTDVAEPDYALAFPGYPAPPSSYDPANFMSAAIQPRYKGGYLQLNSDPNVPLPQGEVQVSYRFQFTGNVVSGSAVQKDVFSVDYDSRQLLSVLITIRNYPQTSLPNPQTVTLKASAKVRNYLR